MQSLIPYKSCLISSAQRTLDSASSTVFSVLIPNTPFVPVVGKVMFAALTNAAVPLTFNTVNATNNVLQVSETQSGVTKTFLVDLPYGQYDLPSFEAAVGQAMTDTSLALGYAVTYSASISTTSGSMTVTPSMVSPNVNTILYFGAPTTADVVLGFPTSGNSGPFNYATPFTGTNVVTISGPLYICIRQKNFTSLTYEVSTQGVSTILATIPITAGLFDLQVYNPFFPINLMYVGGVVNSLDFEITDENGIVLDLKGSNLAFTLTTYLAEPDAVGFAPIHDAPHKLS